MLADGQAARCQHRPALLQRLPAGRAPRGAPSGNGTCLRLRHAVRGCESTAWADRAAEVAARMVVAARVCAGGGRGCRLPCRAPWRHWYVISGRSDGRSRSGGCLSTGHSKAKQQSLHSDADRAVASSRPINIPRKGFLPDEALRLRRSGSAPGLAEQTRFFPPIPIAARTDTSVAGWVGAGPHLTTPALISPPPPRHARPLSCRRFNGGTHVRSWPLTSSRPAFVLVPPLQVAPLPPGTTTRCRRPRHQAPTTAARQRWLPRPLQRTQRWQSALVPRGPTARPQR